MSRGRRSQGEGSVYEFKPGIWAASVNLGVIDGKRRRKVVYAPSEPEAIAKRDELRRLLGLGVDLAAPPSTMKEWLTEWMVSKTAEGAKATTLDRYRQVINNHLVPHLGKIKLDMLTPRDVQKMIAGLVAAKLSTGSVIKIHAVLRSALSDAMRLDLVPRNVAKFAKLPAAGRTERRALTPEEAHKLLAELAGDRLEPLFMFALATGLRRGELLGLRWEDVDIEGKRAYVRQTVQRVSGGLQISTPKTHRSARGVTLGQIALSALAIQAVNQQTEKAYAEELWLDTGQVFANTLGGLMEPRNVNRRFQAARKAAGLEWLDLHDLRHAFATYLLPEGHELREVMDALGHSTIRLTGDTYGHVLPGRSATTGASIDRIMGYQAPSGGAETSSEEGSGEDN